MDLENRIARDKEVLAEKWHDLILGTYPEETRKIWKRNKDRFANPVGSAIAEATGEIIEQVLAWDDAEAISTALEKIVKIRAVQEFSPSQALSFVFLLKKLVRDQYMAELKKAHALDQLLAFETKVDNVALMAMDVFSRRREMIFDMRVKEVKLAQHKLLMRAGMIVGDPDAEAG